MGVLRYVFIMLVGALAFNFGNNSVAKYECKAKYGVEQCGEIWLPEEVINLVNEVKE